MKKNEPIIYKINIMVESVHANTLQKRLSELGVPISNQRIVGGSIVVDRLCTLYRGENEEKVWQQSIRDICDATFSIDLWTPFPGYPKGEIGEPTTEDSIKPIRAPESIRTVTPSQEKIEL